MANEVIIPDGTDEERKMYLKLIKKFGLRVKKVIAPIPGAVKVIQVDKFCSLCEVGTSQYIKMQKYTDDVWKKECDLTVEEAKEIPQKDLRCENVATCKNCVNFLMDKDKMELVKIIMQMRSDILINKATHQVLKDMREKKND